MTNKHDISKYNMPPVNEHWQRRCYAGGSGKWEMQIQVPMPVRLQYIGMGTDGELVFKNEMANEFDGVEIVQIKGRGKRQKEVTKLLRSKEFYYVWKTDKELTKCLYDHAVNRQGWIFETLLDGIFGGKVVCMNESEEIDAALIGAVYTGMPSDNGILSDFTGELMRKVVYKKRSDASELVQNT